MYLVIKGRNEAVRNIQLDADRNTWLIGRESSCDIVLNSSQISRRHAKLICENNQFYIEDCGSALGTFIGNVKVSARENLSAGEVVRIGTYNLVLSGEEIIEDAAENMQTGERSSLSATFMTR